MNKSHIICINLPGTDKRKNQMIEQFERSEITDYSFWSGFDGRKIINNSFGAKIIYGYGLGKDFTKLMIAMMIAHTTALKLAQYLNLDHVVILEDDVFLCKDWNNRMDVLLQYLPEDWEHVYLGGWSDYVKLEVHEKPAIFRSPKITGGWSYMVHKRAYEKIIDFFTSLITTGDEIFLYKIEQGKLISYVYMPFMAYPRGEDSIKLGITIENKELHPSYKYFKDQL
jgi:GR25 family glycosyltransferase involved in LPS biosynthesis